MSCAVHVRGRRKYRGRKAKKGREVEGAKANVNRISKIEVLLYSTRDYSQNFKLSQNKSLIDEVNPK